MDCVSTKRSSFGGEENTHPHEKFSLRTLSTCVLCVFSDISELIYYGLGIAIVIVDQDVENQNAER